MQTVALRSGTQSPPLRRGDRRPTRRPLRGLAAWRETNNAAPTTARSSSRSAPTPGQVAQSREDAKSSAKTPSSRTCRPSPLERDAKPTSLALRRPGDLAPLYLSWGSGSAQVSRTGGLWAPTSRGQGLSSSSRHRWAWQALRASPRPPAPAASLPPRTSTSSGSTASPLAPSPR